MTTEQTCDEQLQEQIRLLEEELAAQRITEKTLRESEERYRRITEAVTDYIFTVRVVKGQPVETIHGAACQAVTGYSTEDFHDDPYLWIRMVVNEDRDIVRNQAACMLSGKPALPIEHRIRRKDGVIRWVRNVMVPEYNAQGELCAYDGLIRDITGIKEAEQKREELLRELSGAIAQVKQLSGLLPICASCKKIRDENGAWQPLEHYIQDHSEAAFSHCICPECTRILYPELNLPANQQNETS